MFHCHTGGVPVRRPVEHGGGGEGLDQQALFIITTSITTSITNITTTITTSIISITILTNRGLSVEKARKLVNNERRMRWNEERGNNIKCDYYLREATQFQAKFLSTSR